MLLANTFRAFRHRHFLLFFLAAGFGFAIVLFAALRNLPLALVFLFIAGGFQTTFLSATATLLQIHTDESNRGRIMFLFGLINRGLEPMGSFPFGSIARAIGVPLTVTACGALTIVLVGYTLLSRPHLREARLIGEI